MNAGTPITAALIVGGGSGCRFGGDKLIHPLVGKPLIAHTLAAFEAAPDISLIVLVVPAGREEEFRAIALEEGVSKLHAILAGGAHRHESVLNGLKALAKGIDLVAIHDAARPLVTPELIARVLRVAWDEGAAAVAAPVTDTLHRVDGEGYLCGSLERSELRAMQTPQVFRISEIHELLSSASGIPTDEVSVALAAGRRVRLVEHTDPNPKITWPSDVLAAEALLRDKNMLKAP